MVTSANLANAIVKLVATDALPALMGNLLMGNLVRRDYEPVVGNVGDVVDVQASVGQAQIEGDKALFQLRVQHCNCGLPMLDVPVAYRNVCWVHDLFPRVHDEGLEAQMRRANIRFVSGSLDVNNKPICQQCEADGKSEFLCDLCQKVKPSSKRKERFGDPPEFLCTDCHATTPAKVWEKAVEDLEAAHKWDGA